MPRILECPIRSKSGYVRFSANIRLVHRSKNVIAPSPKR